MIFTILEYYYGDYINKDEVGGEDVVSTSEMEDGVVRSKGKKCSVETGVDGRIILEYVTETCYD
jgi:hypothetical protein